MFPSAAADLQDLIAKSDGSEAMTAATALLQFLAYAKEKEYDCSEVTGAEPSYLLAVSVLGEGTIVPVWKISSDVGDYYVKHHNWRHYNFSRLNTTCEKLLQKTPESVIFYW